MKIFSSNLADKILSDFRTEKVNNVCTYKGKFEISPDLHFDV